MEGMTAHGPRPEADASGAPLVAGGQAGGAGMLAPGASSPELLWVDVEQLEKQLKEMENELEAEIESECRWIADRLDYINGDPVYGSYTSNALGTYENIAFRYQLHAHTVESIMRVIDVCKKAETAMLLDYAPDTHKVIEKLEEAIEELKEEVEEDEEDDEERAARAAKLEWLTNLVNALQEMKYIDFLNEGEEILEKLRKYGYYDEARELYYAIDVNNVLSDVLIDELRLLGEKFNIENEVEDLIGCMVGC